MARITYPVLNGARSRPAYYLRREPWVANLRFDELRFSNRGNELPSQIRVTRKLRPIAGADLLVLGVGHGGELGLWKREQPRSITAVDFHESERWLDHPDVRFAAMDIRDLELESASYDVVVSYSVLEHVDGVEDASREMARVARQGGLVFAHFAPLYFTYGGAHYHGAYEHIWLDTAQFTDYLVARAIPEEADGLSWLRQGMFSRRTYREYLAILERDFSFDRIALSISTQARGFRKTHRAEWQSLKQRYPEEDLLIFGASVWMRPKARMR